MSNKDAVEWLDSIRQERDIRASDSPSPTTAKMFRQQSEALAKAIVVLKALEESKRAE